jgi:hypothetical protein
MTSSDHNLHHAETSIMDNHTENFSTGGFKLGEGWRPTQHTRWASTQLGARLEIKWIDEHGEELWRPVPSEFGYPPPQAPASTTAGDGGMDNRLNCALRTEMAMLMARAIRDDMALLLPPDRRDAAAACALIDAVASQAKLLLVQLLRHP